MLPLQAPCVFRLAAGTGCRREGAFSSAASPHVRRQGRVSGLRVARHGALCPGRRAHASAAASADWSGAEHGALRPGGWNAGRQRSALSRLAAAALEPSEGSPEAAPEPSAPALSPALRLQALAMVAWDRVLRPLRDFGFGRRNLWEGGVGLFLLGGVGAHCSPLLYPLVRCALVPPGL
jgi:hypothetical protein